MHNLSGRPPHGEGTEHAHVQVVCMGDHEQIEQPLAGIDGVAAYYLTRTADGGARVSVYEHEARTTESTKVAAAFIGVHHPGVTVEPPPVVEGTVVIDLH